MVQIRSDIITEARTRSEQEPPCGKSRHGRPDVRTTGRGAACLSTEAVEGTAGALESIDDIKGSDGLPTGEVEVSTTVYPQM